MMLRGTILGIAQAHLSVLSGRRWNCVFTSFAKGSSCSPCPFPSQLCSPFGRRCSRRQKWLGAIVLALTLIAFSALTLTFLLGAFLEYRFSSYADAVFSFEPTNQCVKEPDFEIVVYNGEEVNCVRLHTEPGVMENLTAYTAGLTASTFMKGVWGGFVGSSAVDPIMGPSSDDSSGQQIHPPNETQTASLTAASPNATASGTANGTPTAQSTAESTTSPSKGGGG